VNSLSIKVLIVDDEPLARARLSRLLSDFPGYTVAGEASNGLEAVQLADACRPDIVLLDIRMPGMDGLEASQHLSVSAEPPAIIFTTAYEDHALAAFEAHAVDYLLKPIRQARLEQALASAGQCNRAQLVAAAKQEEAGARNHICARVGERLQLVPVAEIYYFRAEQKYVTVRHRQGEMVIEESLKALAQEFNADFTRVHRNTLVANAMVAGLVREGEGGHAIALRDAEDRLEVSRRLLPAVRKKLRGKPEH
jgi:two-component system response regulator AlgR